MNAQLPGFSYDPRSKTARFYPYVPGRKGRERRMRTVFAETIDFQKDKAATEGILAFQIHAGLGDMTVQFKDILLKKLPSGGEITPEQLPIPKDAKKIEAPAPKKK